MRRQLNCRSIESLVISYNQILVPPSVLLYSHKTHLMDSLCTAMDSGQSFCICYVLRVVNIKVDDDCAAIASIRLRYSVENNVSLCCKFHVSPE